MIIHYIIYILGNQGRGCLYLSGKKDVFWKLSLTNRLT